MSLAKRVYPPSLITPSLTGALRPQVDHQQPDPDR